MPKHYKKSDFLEKHSDRFEQKYIHSDRNTTATDKFNLGSGLLKKQSSTKNLKPQAQKHSLSRIDSMYFKGAATDGFLGRNLLQLGTLASAKRPHNPKENSNLSRISKISKLSRNSDSKKGGRKESARASNRGKLKSGSKRLKQDETSAESAKSQDSS